MAPNKQPFPKTPMPINSSIILETISPTDMKSIHPMTRIKDWEDISSFKSHMSTILMGWSWISGREIG